MIVRSGDDSLLVLRQMDHAHLCGPLVDAWNADVPERTRVAEAAAHHDDGWARWEAAPRVDGDGRPHTYRNMPVDPYVQLWQDGVQDALERDPLVGLLVSLHGTRFFNPERAPAYRVFHDEQRHLQTKLLTDLGYGGAPTRLPPQIAFMRDLIGYLDGLSLFLCEHWESPWTARVPLAPGIDARDVRVTRGPDGENARLDPFPFRESVTVHAPATRVPGTRFDSDDAFRAALADAETVTLTWTLDAADA